jgi:myo-inositol 2-dehydrogenase / D-chiro-inositol 1-dehydrogenase
MITRSEISRRQFLGGVTATAAALTLASEPMRAAQPAVKLKWGLIGCGGRGSWIANLFQEHGGYNLIAVADYFEDRANAVGQKFQIAAERRFTGLSGYKRLLEENLDAVVIQSPPYFHPEQAAAAVNAGKHVYLAKPVAVDVPGCLTIAETGRRATEKGLIFVVDFQTRANPHYQKAIQLVRDGLIGQIASGEATYLCGPTFTGIAPILQKNPSDPETQLRAWSLNRQLSGDIITEQNIHALDVACWILGSDPIKAVGAGGEIRGLGGTCWDHFSVTYWFPKDILLTFSSKQYGYGWDDICCRMYGDKGVIDTHYFGTIKVKGAEDGYSAGPLNNLYTEGAINNIAAFADRIHRGDASNCTVSESVRSNLTTILGRTAAYKKREVTWDELMKANEPLHYDLKGLKA